MDEENGEEAGDSGPFGIEKAKFAFGACCCGILLLPCMLIMLGANEKGYVCRNKDIMYAQKDAVEVGCTGTPPNDQFVFFSCAIDASKLRRFTLKDFNPAFDANHWEDKITFNSAAASQTVEMYQCVESSSTNAKKETTYSYGLEWSSRSIEAAGFNNTTKANGACGTNFAAVKNPGFPPNVVVSSTEERISGGVPVGMFKLHTKLSDSFQADTTVSLPAFVNKFPTTLPNIAASTTVPLITKDNVRPIGDYLMTCNTAQLGCVRISFKKNGATHASAFANSGTGGTTAPQPTKSSWGCGAGKFAEVFQEQKTKPKAIGSLESSNTGKLWALRFLGVLLSWAAVFGCMYPIIAAFDIVSDYLGEVPCVGCVLKMIADIVETLVTIVVCCMSCSFGCSCAFFVIAVVWVVMRPTVGIVLLIIVVVLTVGAILLVKLVPKKDPEADNLRTSAADNVPDPETVGKDFE